VQQDSRGDSWGQSRGVGRRDTQYLHLFGPQVECNRTVEEIAVDRAGEGRRQKRYSTQHLQLFGPQVECNRTVEEIAVDRAGEEAEEILSTYSCLVLRLSATGQSRR
jgi:hypothetical protein